MAGTCRARTPVDAARTPVDSARMTAPARSLLRHPDFLKLWTAETVSVLGSQVTGLAVPLIAATILDVTAFQFGLLHTVEMLPFILLSLPAGVLSLIHISEPTRPY